MSGGEGSVVAHDQVMLDTNILLAIGRDNTLGQTCIERFGLLKQRTTPLISFVTLGEIYSLALKFGWGERRTSFIDELRKQLVVVPIERSDILNAYSKIDHCSYKDGKKVGKNDLWIAATAHVTDALLLTTDKDFDHLNGSHLRRILLDPHTGELLGR